MYKKLALASMLIGFWQVPIPIDPVWEIPVGPLPWDLPQLPIIQIDFGISPVNPSDVQHTDDYADNLDDITGAIASVTSLQGDITAEINDWIGSEAQIPDIQTEGDIATGIDAPGYGEMSAYDIAEEMGTNLGTLFNLLRGFVTVAQDIDLGGAGLVIGFVFLCFLWMLFVAVLKFAVQVADMLFSVSVRLIELIPFAE